MRADLARRLKQLEQRASGNAGPPLPCWMNEGETPAEAAARTRPDGPPHGRRVSFFGWLPLDAGNAPAVDLEEGSREQR